ncbi:hypothetical protein [Chryseobacterium shigense]|uniref:Uncharacterized protein n=1 Tax=Chryseobacterium shigense TaxID=297244 RepID=A0A841NMK5_9FLAO|nr:hypothetical protein [Chryseobacterium shigense]MBB6372459.1 hypothetical protein [Chryseobacterium shigense]
MGRNTEIYRFDKEKASAYLYKDLQHRIFHTGTFREYLKNRKKDLSGYEISFDKILGTVKSDINMITADELFEINLFLSDEIHSAFERESYSVRENHFLDLCKHYGILLLYELPTSTVCTSYMFQYGNYTQYFPIEEMRDVDGGINIDSKDFLCFNDYMILLTEKILSEKLNEYGHDFTENEKKVIDEIKAENINNSLLSEEVENEFIYLKDIISTDDSGPEAQTVYYAYDFFLKSLEMKSLIDLNKNPRIVILDS